MAETAMFTEVVMRQGGLSTNCFESLSPQEVYSLSRIRSFYDENPVFMLSVEQTLSLIDRAYESMGRSFRNRINTQTVEFGRYHGELDGVFIVLSDALRTYEDANHFHSTPAEAKEIHKNHKKNLARARKALDTGFADIVGVVNGMLPSVWSRSSSEKLQNSLSVLNEIQTMLEEHIALIDFESRSDSRAESFVNGVCMSLVWNANIKPTKPMTDSHKKTPLLRFLEVFYPVEANSILSKIFDRERGLPPSERIGAKFINPR